MSDKKILGKFTYTIWSLAGLALVLCLYLFDSKEWWCLAVWLPLVVVGLVMLIGSVLIETEVI